MVNILDSSEREYLELLFYHQAQTDISNRKKKMGEQENVIKEQTDKHNELLQKYKTLERQISERVCCKVFTMAFFNPFPNNKFLDSSKLKEFAEDNFKLDENGRTFSKCVENTVGKGEIACYEQFLFFLQCFQKAYTADT